MSRTQKMANFLSKAKHPPTTNRWVYGDGHTHPLLKVAMWNVNGIRSIMNKGNLH